MNRLVGLDFFDFGLFPLKLNHNDSMSAVRGQFFIAWDQGPVACTERWYHDSLVPPNGACLFNAVTYYRIAFLMEHCDVFVQRATYLDHNMLHIPHGIV